MVAASSLYPADKTLFPSFIWPLALALSSSLCYDSVSFKGFAAASSSPLLCIHIDVELFLYLCLSFLYILRI